MKPNQFVYLKLHFPTFVKIAALLLSKPALWVYATALLLPLLIDMITLQEGFIMFFGSLIISIPFILLTKIFLAFIIKKILCFLYIFYPRSWRVDDLNMDINEYFSIYNALDNSDLVMLR